MTKTNNHTNNTWNASPRINTSLLLDCFPRKCFPFSDARLKSQLLAWPKFLAHLTQQNVFFQICNFFDRKNAGNVMNCRCVDVAGGECQAKHGDLANEEELSTLESILLVFALGLFVIGYVLLKKCVLKKK